MSAVVLLLAVVVMMGWLLDIPALKSVIAGRVTMKFNTALGLGVAALGLRGLGIGRAVTWRRVAWLSAIFVALLGLVTLAEYGTGWDAGIDNLLWHEESDAVATTRPGRMSPQTALNFTLLGAAYLLSLSRLAVARTVAWIAVTCVALIALLALAGQLYGAVYLYGISRYTGVAVHTAVGFLLLGIGYFCSQHEGGRHGVFFSPYASGVAARRLTPVAILLPLALGWLRVIGEKRGLYDTAGGSALLTVAIIAIGTLLIALTTRAIYRADRALQASAMARERAIIELQKALEDVRTLRGLLPLCAWCGKIRNEAGDWQDLATYVVNHTDAALTHGICKACAQVHFPDEMKSNAAPSLATRGPARY